VTMKKVGTAKRRAAYDVTPEKFITVWQTSESADEVAEKLKMPKPIVLARASGYRRGGLKLKKMPRRPGKGLDIERLNRLIEELNGKREPP
jgi:hypothetical protein